MFEISSQFLFRSSGAGLDPVAPKGEREPFEAQAQAFGAAPRDSVMISSEARALAERDGELEASSGGEEELEAVSAEESGEPKAPGELTPEEKKAVAELSARDREVRAHEQAHASVGGDLAGSPSYEYESGPDGKRYAVAGEVPIELREGSDPEETLQNAQTVRRAALAPAEPSPQDRSVAAAASQMEARARAEILEERAAEVQGGSSEEASSLAEGINSSRSEGAREPSEALGSSVAPERESRSAVADRDLAQAASAYRTSSLGEEVFSGLSLLA